MTTGAKRRKPDGPVPVLASPLASRTPLWGRPGYLVRRLHQIHTALFAEECGSFDITPVQYGVLTTLLLRPDIDQNSLGREVGIDRANAADVLNRLRKRGMVVRRRSDEDRRMVLARLTPEGERITQAMRAAMQRAQDRLLAPLPPPERAVFMDMLTKLVDGNNHVGRATLRPS